MQAGRPLNFSDPVVQEQMDNSLEVFQGNEYVVGGTLESWWLEMTADGPAPGVRCSLCWDISTLTHHSQQLCASNANLPKQSREFKC